MGKERELSLGSVQKTLLLPLWARAIETEEQEPILVDRLAVELVGRLHYDFSTISKNIAPVVRLNWIAQNKRKDPEQA